MAEVSWTSEAQRWLEDIFEYIAEENPIAAARAVSALYERVQVLEAHPEIGHRYESTERNVRILLHQHYRIAYRVKSDGNVDILGVFHGALDMAKYQL